LTIWFDDGAVVFTNFSHAANFSRMKFTYLFVAFLIGSSTTLLAQTTLTLDSALASSYRYHPSLMESNAGVLEQQRLRGAAFALPNPELTLETPEVDFTWEVSQSFDFPTAYVSRHKMGKQNMLLAQSGADVTKAELRQQVRLNYLDLQHAQARVSILRQQDSLLANVARATQRRLDAGDVGLLENLNAQNSYQAKHIELLSAQSDERNAAQQLALATGLSLSNRSADTLQPSATGKQFTLDNAGSVQSPWVSWATQNAAVAKQNLKVERASLLPSFNVAYLHNDGNPAVAPTRVDFGITVPIWFWSYTSRIAAAKYRYQQTDYRLQRTLLEQNGLRQRYLSDLAKYEASMSYYQSTALPQSDAIESAATRSYTSGAIGYVEFLQNIQMVFDTRLAYLDAVRNYNETVIQLQTLYGQ
jgi:outer membrane protein, heavy metal efflux system